MPMIYTPIHSYTVFDFEVEELDIDELFRRKCTCGCGYVQIFTMNDCRIDVMLRDDARELYE